MPPQVHPTGKEPGQPTNKAHALGNGNDSTVAKKASGEAARSAERQIEKSIVVVTKKGSKLAKLHKEAIDQATPLSNRVSPRDTSLERDSKLGTFPKM